MGHLLLVDDEPALLRLMGSYLTRLGYPVITAHSTDDAWQKASGLLADLALAVLDATVGGEERANSLAIRLLQANPSLCVVLTSGYPVEMAAVEAEAPDRVVFLQKPFGPENLAEVVRRMIGPPPEKIRPEQGSAGHCS